MVQDTKARKKSKRKKPLLPMSGSNPGSGTSEIIYGSIMISSGISSSTCRMTELVSIKDLASWRHSK